MFKRQQVVEEALSWLGTPYRHMGKIKGGGVDCGQYLLQVYNRAGIIPVVDTGYYPQDWHLHQHGEKYLKELMRHAVKVDRDPLPGDIIMFKWGRCAAHGAIVLEWPRVIHSYVEQGVIISDVLSDPELTKRMVGVYDPFKEEGGE